MTSEDLEEALLQAARAARDERLNLGLEYTSEWPMRGRLAIQLARQAEIIKLERQHIHVDIEYGQETPPDVHKIPGDARIDLIVHRRGTQSSNLLAVELKIDNAKATKVNSVDNDKLLKLTTKCGFRTGIWIRLPRTRAGHPGRYAVYRRHEKVSLYDL
jgi:hypothetical protein